MARGLGWFCIEGRAVLPGQPPSCDSSIRSRSVGGEIVRVTQYIILSVVSVFATVSTVLAAEINPSIPPPPPIAASIDPGTPVYTTYSAQLFGNRPEQHAGIDHSTLHYIYTPQSRGVFAYLNERDDCSSTNAKIVILRTTAHGRLIVDFGPPNADVGAHFWANPSDGRGHCDTTKMQGLWLRYSPAPGFVGADFAVVDVTDGNDVRHEEIWIQVPPTPQ